MQACVMINICDLFTFHCGPYKTNNTVITYSNIVI